MPIPPLALPYQLDDVAIPGYPVVERRLSQLAGCFVDPQAYAAALRQGDRLAYQVTNIETGEAPAQLDYSLAILYPGKVGREYMLTRGHIHAWRPSAEVYICLSGTGLMLLENTETGDCRAVPLNPNSVVYVPGYTTHRTVNVGEIPLVYWGVLPSEAGHDYEYVQKHGFRQVILEQDGKPVVIRREDYAG